MNYLLLSSSKEMEILVNFSGNYPFIFVGLITLIITYLLIRSSKKSKLPPGPWGVPLLGNLLQMVKDPHLKLSAWAKQYGKLTTIRMATRPALIINDAKYLKELFATTPATGKFKTDTMLLISQGPYGILNTEGKAWNEQRQFCMKNLKSLGFGNGRSMEPLILDEGQAICDWVRETRKLSSNKTVEFDRVLNQATGNCLWAIVSGERIKLGDAEVVKLVDRFTAAMQYTMQTGLGFFPWLKYIAPELSGYVEFDTACRDVHNFIQGKFEEHKKSYESRVRRDLMDVYIEHLNELAKSGQGDEQKSFQGKTGWINSVSSVVEIFLSGGETTSVTVNWATIYLAHDQRVQRKVQEEIDRVVGRDREPSLMDRQRMPYIDAVISEVLRITSAVALGVPHELIEDINFHGYNLPKGMILIPNLYHTHHDPEVWGDPDVFRPERFLEEGGEKMKEFLVPFSTGKRQCLGEPLAREIMFLFVLKLFQQFNVSLDPSVPVEDYFKSDVGVLIIPQRQGLVTTPR